MRQYLKVGVNIDNDFFSTNLITFLIKMTIFDNFLLIKIYMYLTICKFYPKRDQNYDESRLT